MKPRRPRARPAPPVLVVLHQAHSTPGRVGRLLQDQGFALDIRRPPLGDPLPDTLAGHAGAVVFGGPMSANDEHDWLLRELRWIDVPLKEGKPFLGICLGGQLLARALGHRVYSHPQGRAEIGYYPIRPTAEGRALCAAPFPERVYQWHREGFDLPAGAALLAEGDDFEAQAFRYGAAAYGLQFHPEVTYAMMCRWTVKAHERMALPGAHPRHAHLSGWFEHDSAVARWSAEFLSRWARRDDAAGPPAPKAL